MITDLVVADFDQDDRQDLAVVWYASHSTDLTQNLRRLTIFYGDGTGNWTRAPDYDLYFRHATIEALSYFRNGTSSAAAGDFDGDGDDDLAVLPFFGDEMWFFENAGNRTFIQRVKFIFGFNSTGNAISPPEAAAADFNGDGREDLVYLIDPTQHLQGRFIHFWRTNSTVAAMSRANWEGLLGGVPTPWLFNMTVSDLDGDDWIDVAFTASGNVEQTEPLLIQWRAFDPLSGQFQIHVEVPAVLGSDVVDVPNATGCAPRLAVGDRLGFSVQFWDPLCDPPGDFAPGQGLDGLTTTASGRGMALAVTDYDLDGDLDLVTRQRGGGPTDPARIQLLENDGGDVWNLVQPESIDTSGFNDLEDNEILRPRNLLAVDLFGNDRPEIVAGYGPSRAEEDPPGLGRLEVAIWWNGCRADINANGRTDISDLSQLLAGMGCVGDGFYLEAADFDHSGCVDLSDLSIMLSEFGCMP